MRIALISLYSLTGTGGGERFTRDAARAIAKTEVELELFSVQHDSFPRTRPLTERLATVFQSWRVIGDDIAAVEILKFQDLLVRLGGFDWIWIHQYLSNDLVFDIIGNCAADQTVLFTNSGHEPVKAIFDCCFQPSENYHFVEISDFAANRSRGPARQVYAVGAGIWLSAIRPDPPGPRPLAHRLCSVGRVLPHKGMDVTIRAIQDPWTLDIIGPDDLDPAYSAHLRNLASNRNVRFRGLLSDSDKDAVVGDADFLIASSTTHLYDGREIPQAELFGLVLCEAVAVNCLPLASDLPPFVEIMNTLGLGALVYQQGNVASLADVLRTAAEWSDEERWSKLITAKRRLAMSFTWDTYFSRVRTALAVGKEKAKGRVFVLNKARILELPVLGYLCRLLMDSVRLPIFRQQVTKSMEGLTLQVRVLEATVHGLSSQVASLQQRIDAVGISDLRASVNHLNSGHVGIREELNTIQFSVDRAFRMIEDLHVTLTELRAEQSAFGKQINEIDGCIRSAVEHLSFIERGIGIR